MKAFPKPKGRRRPSAPAPLPWPWATWKIPDPFHVSVEERRRSVLRERPVLFWSG